MVKLLTNYEVTQIHPNTKSYSLIEELQNISILGKIVITQKKNNFIISVCNQLGEVLFTISPGSIGYRKGNRKNPLTYKEVAKELAIRIKKDTVLSNFELIFKGICKGKSVLVNTLIASEVAIFSIVTEHFYPKNGCKPRKQRRL